MNSIMWFTEREKAAINHVAKAMIVMDGEVESREIVTNIIFNTKFGITVEMGDNMDLDEALNVLAALSSEEKRAVCAYLGTLMAIDEVIDAREMFFWSLLSHRCGFPEMNVVQAATYFNNHIK